MIRYIDEHRRSFGVEPICRTLAVACPASRILDTFGLIKV